MTASTQITRLRRSDFSFHGFDHLESELDTFLDDVWIRSGEPVARVEEDAVFIPLFEVGRSQFEGALLTNDGVPVPTSVSQRRFGAFGNEVLGTLSQPVALNPEHVIEDEVVYLGRLVDHFGHVMLETLSRAWILDHVPLETRVIFHLQGSPELSLATRRMLEHFGVPPERIVLLDTQTLLRRVIVPEALYEISYAAHERVADAYRRVAERIIRSDVQTDQPVYLSRRLLPSQQRPIVGELEMEDVLRENGFLVAHTETMSFEEQVRLISRHRHVFSSSGSAAYLALFAPRPPMMHMLTAGIPFHDYFLVPRAIGAEASYCNCFTGDNRPEQYYVPPVLEMPVLADYLDRQGMLKRRERAAVTARVVEFKPAYDELRLYAHLWTNAVFERALPSEIEAEALAAAQSSWPLCWLLARYYLVHDPTRIEGIVQQFNHLLSAESDPGRLARFQGDVRTANGRVMRHLKPETAAGLKRVMLDRLQINFEEERAQRKAQRGRQGRRRPGRTDSRGGGPETDSHSPGQRCMTTEVDAPS